MTRTLWPVATALAVIVCLCGSSAQAVVTRDSWYVEISNLSEYRHCPTIGPWVMTGFFQGFSGTQTDSILPVVSTDGSKLTFDFRDGYVIDGQYAWTSPTFTLCWDRVYREVFDWRCQTGTVFPSALRLQLWAWPSQESSEEELVWSVAPGAGIRCGQADVSFTSWDRVQFRMLFGPVPEPCSFAALLTLLAPLFIGRRR